MSKIKITAVMLTAMTLHGAAFATQPSASGSGVVAIQNVVKGNFSLGNNGTSTSFAQNKESGMAKVTASANYLPCYQAVNAGISGATETKSSGQAYNISTGSGTGSATSRGDVSAAVHGQAAIHGVTDGYNGGKSGTDTHNRIVADTNQGSAFAAGTTSGFDLALHYEKLTTTVPAQTGSTGGIRTTTVKISDKKTGYVSGATDIGKLDGMNAAGIANLGSSGDYFVRANLSASTGKVTAP
ncbi:hypothetical protein GCM10022212_09680 [Actimicrobium antarcticum]|uniref:Uncharacterized protein n=2 Tax=Actimicrobium antarcticum TaxID=1051899 RepID=A0ABP7SUD4_9BURK